MNDSAPQTAQASPHLVFTLGMGMFAVAMSAVRAVVRCDDLGPPPAAGPAGLRGTTELLGASVPVIDLSLCMGGDADDLTRSSHVVAIVSSVGAATRVLGVLAGAVHGIRDLAPTPLRLAAASDAPLDPGWAAGRAPLDHHAVLVLAADRLPLLAECGIALPASAAGFAASHLTATARILTGLRMLVSHFDVLAAQLVGPPGAGSLLDSCGAEDVATALESMQEALTDAARVIDALGGDTIARAACADGIDELRSAFAARRARLDREIAALRPAPRLPASTS